MTIEYEVLNLQPWNSGMTNVFGTVLMLNTTSCIQNSRDSIEYSVYVYDNKRCESPQLHIRLSVCGTLALSNTNGIFETQPLWNTCVGIQNSRVTSCCIRILDHAFAPTSNMLPLSTYYFELSSSSSFCSRTFPRVGSDDGSGLCSMLSKESLVS